MPELTALALISFRASSGVYFYKLTSGNYSVGKNAFKVNLFLPD